MKGSAFRTAVCAVLASFATAATAQEAAKPAGPRFEFHGFVGGSVFAQDGNTAGSNWGQNATFAGSTPNSDRISFGGDARQTRLNLSLTGGKRVFGDAIPSAVTEMDFLGGSAGGGAYANIGVTPRLRLAYAQLNWGSFILRLGQDSDLIQGGISPASVGHVPTNLAYNAGYIGNRHTGLFLFENLPFSSSLKLELGLQVSRAQWNDTLTDPNSNGLSFAESSGLPMVQARVKLRSTAFEFYVAGTWNTVDFSGVDNVTGGRVPCAATGGQSGCKDREVVAGNAGIKIVAGPLTLQGSGNVGKNMGAHNGAIGQFQDPRLGDLHSWAGWGQIGLNLGPVFSIWGLAGTEHMNYDEVRDIQRAAGFGGTVAAPTAGRLQNIVYSGMLRFMDGGYAIGLEGTHWTTKYYTVPNALSRARSPNGVLDVNQLMLSGMYFF